MTPTFGLSNWLHTTSGIVVLGWIVFFCYLGIAALAWKTSLVLREDPDQEHIKKRVMVWQIMALFLLFMGLNKHLDLHGPVWVFLRDWSAMLGLDSSSRHFAYMSFVIGLGAVVVFLAVGFMGILGMGTRRIRLGLIGVLVLLLALVLRLLTLRAFNAILGWNLSGWGYNWLVELIGLGLITWSAAHTIRQVHINRHAHNLIAVI